MKRKLFILFFSFMGIVSCRQTQSFSSSKKTGDQYWTQDPSINFLVVGDWGRNGEFHQTDVANQMVLVATKSRVSFVLSMGIIFIQMGL